MCVCVCVCACVLEGRGAGVFKAGHHYDWTVCFHLIGERDGKAEASVPAVPSTWPWRGWNGSADDQCLQRCTHNHFQHMHLDYDKTKSKCQVMSWNSRWRRVMGRKLIILKVLNYLAQSDSCYIRSQLASCFTFKWLVSIHKSNSWHAFRDPLKPFTFPSSTCIDLLRLLYCICYLFSSSVLNTHNTVSAYGLTVASSCTCFAAAAAIIYNNSNNQLQRSTSIPPNSVILSYP